MTNLIAALVALLQAIPAAARSWVYKIVGWVALVLTVVVLLASQSELLFGVTVPPRPVAIATTWLALLSLLAGANVTRGRPGS